METAAGITFCVAAWCLWIRRNTWRCKWETANTISIALLAVSQLMRLPPVSYIFSALGRHISCQYNMEFFESNMFIVCGLCAGVYSAVAKLTDDDVMGFWFLTRITIPISGSFAVMFILFTASKVSDAPHSDFLTTPSIGLGMQLYWLLWCATVAYLIFHGMRAFADLYHDGPSQAMMRVCLTAGAVLFAGTACRSAYAVRPGHLTVELAYAHIVISSIGSMMFALVATHAWRKRLAWFSNRPGWSGPSGSWPRWFSPPSRPRNKV